MLTSTRRVLLVAGALFGFAAACLFGLWLVTWLMSEAHYSCACPDGVQRDGWTSGRTSKDEFCKQACAAR